jgi:hypothetical protein
MGKLGAADRLETPSTLPVHRTVTGFCRQQPSSPLSGRYALLTHGCVVTAQLIRVDIARLRHDDCQPHRFRVSAGLLVGVDAAFPVLTTTN